MKTATAIADPSSVGIHFGALCDDISKQIKKQGFSFDKETVSAFQKDADAISRLKVRGYLGDKEGDKSRSKLFAEIKKHVCAHNKPAASKSTTPIACNP